ncbi:DUF1810 domain-containing protein [Pedobacter mucosus]|uniref:DUF1810 domain-containing protein n=1 Tax=Pedobacter mucosus TaxID=2895286 RepID=UPI001EE4DD07|nr:DUF1810 domain-containing protein [Pedobacter mucosus]UKT65746.1 DUF1810 domain-containing protein [Pedobacter mucosus]
MENLQKFLDAQQNSYPIALSEIVNGKKQSHWMWYIFPQIEGLGTSETAKFYSIKDINEAQDYFNHEILGNRLVEISKALFKLKSNDALQILGSPDDMKLKSSMTLFASLDNSHPIFDQILNKFFGGQSDMNTKRILGLS